MAKMFSPKVTKAATLKPGLTHGGSKHDFSIKMMPQAAEGDKMKKMFRVFMNKSLGRQLSYAVVFQFDIGCLEYYREANAGKDKDRGKIIQLSHVHEMEIMSSPGESFPLQVSFPKDDKDARKDANKDAMYSKKVFNFRSAQDRNVFVDIVQTFKSHGEQALKEYKLQQSEFSIAQGTGGFVFLDDGTRKCTRCSAVIEAKDMLKHNCPKAVETTYKTVQRQQQQQKQIIEDFASFLVSYVPVTKEGSEKLQTGVAHRRTATQGGRSNRSAHHKEPQEKTKMKLLSGEVVYMHKTRTASSHMGVGLAHQGNLFVTNYRMFYEDLRRLEADLEIPLCSIAKMEQKNRSVDIVCKEHGREVSFSFSASQQDVRSTCSELLRLAFPGNSHKTFSFQHKVEPPPIDASARNIGEAAGTLNVNKQPVDRNGRCGWALYDPIKEYTRCNVADFKQLRLVDNKSFRISPTYPEVFYVPAEVDSESLLAICKYRSKARVPAVVWRSASTGALLARCAQPQPGITGKRCSEDEKMVNLLRLPAEGEAKFIQIFDARPYKAAYGNKVMGKGYEEAANYEHAEITFCGIDNIHNVRASLEKLTALCVSPLKEEAQWFVMLAETKWLHYIRLLLLASVRMVISLEETGESVLVHCSDGWDRTSQLAALAQIMLDPYYRTLVGFAILIEKEWVSFGHQFALRCGHADADHTDTQRAPIFRQFMDAVWQLLNQFPTAFEFNEWFLIEILDAMLSCRFGTFLFNCEREKYEHKTKIETTSVWTYLLHPANLCKFVNATYAPGLSPQPMIPQVAFRNLALWSGLHLRNEGSNRAHIDARQRTHQALLLYKRKYEMLSIIVKKQFGVSAEHLLRQTLGDDKNTTKKNEWEEALSETVDNPKLFVLAAAEDVVHDDAHFEDNGDLPWFVNASNDEVAGNNPVSSLPLNKDYAWKISPRVGTALVTRSFNEKITQHHLNLLDFFPGRSGLSGRMSMARFSMQNGATSKPTNSSSSAVFVADWANTLTEDASEPSQSVVESRGRRGQANSIEYSDSAHSTARGLEEEEEMAGPLERHQSREDTRPIPSKAWLAGRIGSQESAGIHDHAKNMGQHDKSRRKNHSSFEVNLDENETDPKKLAAAQKKPYLRQIRTGIGRKNLRDTPPPPPRRKAPGAVSPTLQAAPDPGTSVPPFPMLTSALSPPPPPRPTNVGSMKPPHPSVGQLPPRRPSLALVVPDTEARQATSNEPSPHPPPRPGPPPLPTRNTRDDIEPLSDQDL